MSIIRFGEVVVQAAMGIVNKRTSTIEGREISQLTGRMVDSQRSLITQGAKKMTCSVMYVF